MNRFGRRTGLPALAAVALLATSAAASIPATPAPGASTSTDRAYALFHRQDYRGARIELLKALKAKPNDPVARLLSARVALEMGSGVAAQVEIEKARTAGAPLAKTHHLMAHALALQDKGDQALREAGEADTQFAAYAARARGWANMSIHQTEAAAAAFDQAARLAPDDVPILVDQIRSLILAGKRPAAERTADHALKLNPASGAPLVLKGDLVRTRLGLSKALPYYDSALDTDADNVEALLERAATLGDLRREAPARADLAHVLRLRPEQPLALFLLATLETRAGRYQQAQTFMERTRQQLADYMPAVMLQGVLAYQLGNPAEADAQLSKVAAAAPDYALGRRFLAAARLATGNAQGAIDALEPLAASPAPSLAVLNELGDAYRRAGRAAEARAIFSRAVKAAPEAQGLRIQLALTEAASGDSAAALAAIRANGANTPQGAATTALIAQRGGDYRAARQAADRLIAAKPQSPLGYYMRGSARAGLGDSNGAVTDYRAALQRDPGFTDARRRLGSVLLDTGQLQAAQAELQTVIGQQPGDARTMLLLSMVAARTGNPAEQVQWANRATIADRGALAPRLALAQAFIHAGQNENAVNTARALERDYPKLPAAAKTAGLAYLAGRNGADAEAAFRRAAQIAPQDIESIRLIAQAQVMQGRLDEARAIYAGAMKGSGPQLLPLYADAVRLAQGGNRAAEAQALIARMRAVYPASNLPDILVGDGLIRTGQRPQAIAAYRAAQAKGFDRLVATRLAAAYREGGQPQQSAATLLAFLKAHPGDPVAVSALGEIQLALGQYRPAAATFEGLLARGAPDTGGAIDNLAWAYLQLDDPRALVTARRALAAAPDSPDAKDTLASALMKANGDKSRAQSLLESAVAARPADADMRYRLAVVHAANGSRAKAVADLQAALQTPNFASRKAAEAMAAKLR